VLPHLVWSGVFSFFSVSRGRFLVFFAPFPEEEISDYLAQRPFIRVLKGAGGQGWKVDTGE